MQRWHLLSRRVNQDFLSNGKTKQDLAVQHPQHLKQVQALQVSHHLHTPLLLADFGNSIQAFQTKCVRKLLCTSYLEHKTNDWVQSKVNFLVGTQNLFRQLSRDGNLHGSGMSHATSASPNHPSRHLGGWVTLCLAEEMLDEQRQRMDVSALARTAYKGLLQKRLEEDLC